MQQLYSLPPKSPEFSDWSAHTGQSSYRPPWAGLREVTEVLTACLTEQFLNTAVCISLWIECFNRTAVYAAVNPKDLELSLSTIWDFF